MLGTIFLEAVFLGAICPRGNYVENKSSERQFSSGAISREILSGGNYLPGSNHPGGNYQGGNIPLGQLSSEAIIQGPIFLGDNCPDTSQKTCNFIKKEALAQMFSCKFCDISKNTFFTEHLRTTTSVEFIFCFTKNSNTR